MLKKVVISLLLLNFVVLSWLLGWSNMLPSKKGREPERIETQLRPELIEVTQRPLPQTPELPQDTPVLTADTEIDNPAEALPEDSPEQTDIAPQENTLPVEEVEPNFCIESGPLSGEQIGQLRTLLRSMVSDSRWELDVYARASSWAVYIGPFETEESAIERQRQLQSQRLEVVLVRNKPKLQPGLTLGLFKEENNAHQLLQKVTNQGVTDAIIQPWTFAPVGQLLRVKQVTQSEKETLEQFAHEQKLPTFSLCAE